MSPKTSLKSSNNVTKKRIYKNVLLYENVNQTKNLLFTNYSK